MDWITLFWLCISLFIIGVISDNKIPSLRQANEVSEPSFAISGRTFRIVIKDTVVLPCEVSNLGNYLVVWKRGIAVLSAGNVKVTPDSRIKLVEGYNLEIEDVRTQDAGDYVCQLGTLQPREITHTLEILVPPRIHHVSSQGVMEVKRGASVTLECRASGNPVPVITWTRKNNLLPSGEKSVEGYSITIEQATRHQAGVYQCKASNGVGSPVEQSIVLHVLYPPEIEVERSWVHSGEGFEAQLVCIVHSEPPADVLWYRDTLRLDTTERRSMEVRGSRHTLIIRKVQASDFGNYSCVADNSLGKMRQYLQLSGKPNQVVFRSDPMGRYKDSYNITWAVNSYTPIEEFKLYFRKLYDHNQPNPPQQHHAKRPTRRNFGLRRRIRVGEGVVLEQAEVVSHVTVNLACVSSYRWNYNLYESPQSENETSNQLGRGEWSDVILPAIPSELFTQQMSYVIRGLEPASQYEARVRARNRFGWNELSDQFHFSTRGEDHPERPEDSEPANFNELDIRDLSMTASYNAGVSVAPKALPLLLIFLLFR